MVYTTWGQVKKHKGTKLLSHKTTIGQGLINTRKQNWRGTNTEIKH